MAELEYDYLSGEAKFASLSVGVNIQTHGQILIPDIIPSRPPQAHCEMGWKRCQHTDCKCTSHCDYCRDLKRYRWSLCPDNAGGDSSRRTHRRPRGDSWTRWTDRRPRSMEEGLEGVMNNEKYTSKSVQVDCVHKPDYRHISYRATLQNPERHHIRFRTDVVLVLPRTQSKLISSSSFYLRLHTYTA